MKYKELYSIEYDLPEWDEIEEVLIRQWNEKIKNDVWYYPDHKEIDKILSVDLNEDVPTIKKLEDNAAKFSFLVQWEAQNKKSKESPLNNIICQKSRFDIIDGRHTYTLEDKMLDEYTTLCRDSFITVNEPVLYDVDKDKDPHDEYANHRMKLRAVFEKSHDIDAEVEDKFRKILRDHFMFKDVCLLIQYKLPDNDDLLESLQKKFDKIILNGNWKILGEDGKLHKPDVRLDFIERFDDDEDCVLNHMYINTKRTLHDEIQNESVKSYRAAFIHQNMNPEIRGTLFEDDSIVKLGRVFDEYYSYLSDQFCISILSMYDKADIVDLFEGK